MKKGLSLFLSLLMFLGIFINIPVVGYAIDNSVINFCTIDKTLMSDGETAVITIQVAEGYTAKWIYIYKPITKNYETVYLYLVSDNTYTGTFKVDDQTESGIWKVNYLTLKDANGSYVYIYNSNTYTGTTRETMDFSSIDFEVVGTNADITAPVIETYSINKTVVSAGESVLLSTKIFDEHLPSSFYLYYKTPGNISKSVSMKKINDTGLFQGTLTIDSETEIGLWRPYYFSISDSNGNSVTLYNSNVSSYGSNKADLSSLNFEVIDVNNDPGNSENSESFIVVFKDGYGNTLSTQRVAKGEDAIEPDTPTSELYLFNGWDTEFTNITSDKVITATWILNPDVTYDREVHIGKTFSIEVFSTASQNYTITCSDDIDFTCNLVGTGMNFADQLYYSKEYEIKVNETGSYLFYVKGSKSSNTLIYKVKVTEHVSEDEWTIDKEPTCTEEGSKSYHCTVCGTKTDITVVEALGHDYSEEWSIDVTPTCTEEGSKSHHCLRCNAKTDVTIIDVLGHNYLEEWTIDKEATCIEEGSKSRHCLRCESKTDVTTIPIADNHTPSSWIIDKKATVNAKGKQHKECTGCGEILETETILQLKCSKPKLLKISNVTKGVKVTWSKVTGADSYRVYRKTSKGDWKYLGSTKKTYFTDESAKSGTKYYYAIKARNEVGNSSLSSSLSIKRLSVPKISKIVNHKDGVKLTWGKIKGAKEYIVYRKTKDGKWKETGYTKDNYYIDSTAKNGKTYYYTVRAYSGSTKSYYNTKGSKIAYLAAPMLETSGWSSTNSEVDLSWSKVKGASGYYVYRATGNGKYKKIATIKGYKNTTYIDKSYKNARIYKYKIKAYNSKTTSGLSNYHTIDYNF